MKAAKTVKIQNEIKTAFSIIHEDERFAVHQIHKRQAAASSPCLDLQNFYNLKHRRGFVASTVAEIGTAESFEAAQRELDYFKEIGLL